MTAARRPGPRELAAAYGATVPDLVAPDLRVLLCGINPSLYSGWTGLHFARPGNRLWRVLHGAGLTSARLEPAQTAELLAAGIGITNLVPRATARADELAAAEVTAGLGRLERCVRRWRPRAVAVLGLGAFRTAFAAPRAVAGEQLHGLEGARLFALPNPSGLNAGYQLPAMIELYALLAAV